MIDSARPRGAPSAPMPPSDPLCDGRPGETRWVPAAAVLRWDRNPRNIEPAVHAVAASIRRFGFVAPAIVWASRGRLVAGHTRLAALETCRLTDPAFVPPGAPDGTLPGWAPVHFHEFASEEAAAAYAIADNRLNELARWDPTVLADLMASLPKADAEATGFEVDLSDLRLPTDLPSLPSSSLGAPSVPPAGEPTASPAKPAPAPRYPPPRTFAVAVVVGSAAEQAKLYELLHAASFPGVTVTELRVLSV